MCGSPHPRLQLERFPVDDKFAIPLMVNGLGVPLRRINPGLEHLENKRIIFFDKPRVDVSRFIDDPDATDESSRAS